jgi:hypothetical protein
MGNKIFGTAHHSWVVGFGGCGAVKVTSDEHRALSMERCWPPDRR